MATTSALAAYTQRGTRAWFADKEEGWISATLDSSSVTETTVKLVFTDERGKEQIFTASLQDLEKAQYATLPPLRNPPSMEATEDLTNLPNLSEAAVLHSIRTRYADKGQIYTFSGIVLVAINPFAPVPLYEANLVQAYAGKRKGDLEPHLFAIAEDAYRCMIRDQRNQTIIVSGESGAGKTVSAKYIMRYFATVDDPERPGRRKTSKDKDGMSVVERQILATNPIMEAFGNAKTTRNDNSSRFGKYIEILFDKTQTIIGARIRTYLLERSRLVYQPEIERNYHIFYQLLAGMPSSDLRAMGLDDANNFHYLNQGGAGAKTISGVDDAEEFAATQKALDTVGITSQTRLQIFQLLGALLHIGNIEIKQTRNDALISDDDPHMKCVVDLLGIDAAEYKKWTVKKQITTKTDKIVTALTAAQAIVVRDSVAKFIYACVFDWLVGIVNESLAKNADGAASFIGVLDIYGFEHFKKNSFEQFCINYANEQLQQEFTAHVFKLEQEEYLAEQINWKFIDFQDNQPTIDLIGGKLGILALLDEESRLPAGSDSTLITKLYSQLDKAPTNKVFKKPRFGTTAFTVAHYAHDVTYDIDGFLEKNRDTVPDEHLAMLNGTTNTFLKDVLDRALASSTSKSADPAANVDATVAKPGRKAGGATARKPTLGSIFKASLVNLKETIDSTNAHYIRCIKPNEAKAAWEFEPPLVLSQLKACGVLETIRISCAGYPTRWSFEEFAERYYMLTSSSNWGPELKELCSMILGANIKEEDKYQVGLSKIFFRAGMLAYMERLRTDRLNYLVTLIQKNALRGFHQARYQRLRKAAIGVQATWRRVQAKREADRRRRENAALSIQRVTRGYLERMRYLRTQRAVITLQAAMRGRQARKAFREARKESAAIRIQSFWRAAAVRRAYQHERRQIIICQGAVRRRQARAQLQTLRVAARSASHFKEVSYKLENKVVELTQALQRRTAENKEQQAKIRALEDSLQSWVTKHDEVEARSRDMAEDHKKSSVALPEFEALAEQKKVVDERLEESLKKIADQDSQLEKLMADLTKQTDEIEARQKLLNGSASNPVADESSTVGMLRAELASLREQLTRATALSQPKNSIGAHPRDLPGAFNMALGKSHDQMNGAPGPFQGTPGKRRNRRGSVSQIYPSDGTQSTLPAYEEYQPRAFSVANYPNDALRKLASEQELDPEALADEIIKLLEAEKSLDDDVLSSIITNLRIPSPSSSTPPIAKEVLFPAHLISLVTNEMWKYGLLRESERFLANVMQTVQQHVMNFQGEEAIIPGIFWLSNVHEILSFVCIAESDILQGIGPGADGSGRDFDWEEYERLVSIVKHDLDSLEYNIYHTWMQETKKILSKMAVPALIEYQALPGFLSNEGGSKLFNRLLSGNSTPAFNTDDILGLLNKTHKALKSYYVEHTVVQQVVTELLKLVGVTAFNELLMRRNFCSWKRAMQIQYNITRLEEWCQSKDMPEGTLQLEHLLQATKLLQLKKSTTHDIEIICDVCWMLSPTQIQKLISNYAVADYETPISTEVLKSVAARVMQGDKNDHLLLPPEMDEVGPYEVPMPREIEDLYTYVPAWVNAPHLRKITSLLDVQ